MSEQGPKVKNPPRITNNLYMIQYENRTRYMDVVSDDGDILLRRLPVTDTMMLEPGRIAYVLEAMGVAPEGSVVSRVEGTDLFSILEGESRAPVAHLYLSR